jgi:hypothetical protein
MATSPHTYLTAQPRFISTAPTHYVRHPQYSLSEYPLYTQYLYVVPACVLDEGEKRTRSFIPFHNTPNVQRTYAPTPNSLTHSHQLLQHYPTASVRRQVKTPTTSLRTLPNR